MRGKLPDEERVAGVSARIVIARIYRASSLEVAEAAKVIEDTSATSTSR